MLVGFLIVIHLWQFPGINLDSLLGGGSRSIEQGRDLQWEYGHSGIYHSYVTLPLNCRDPRAGHVRIALAQMPARIKTPLGSLIISMGHPGESGTKALYEVGEEIMDIIEGSYNLIGFDARGVNLTSNHLSCSSDDITKQWFYSENKDELYSLRGRGCSGLGRGAEKYISTALTATDLLRISRILGDDKLNYIGFSYGSIIGNTFSQLSPSRVGRMALGGVIDPEMYYTTGKTLKHVKCILPECKEIEDTISNLQEQPLEVHDKQNGISDIVTHTKVEQALASALSEPKKWPQFVSSIRAIQDGNGTPFLQKHWRAKFDVAFEAGYVTRCSDSKSGCAGHTIDPILKPPNFRRIDVPILLLGTAKDPIISFEDVIKVSTYYTQPTIIQQDTVGHCAFSQLTESSRARLRDWFLQ
ncbi:hypothetical protein TRICI_004609 [Trichomonascus ciferrii]|uniref:AB hydrolase-1 domain-containing protein n=1 Tax=Trichomonascus ciferrii TaxID=44093 RepID=A0A642V0I4_9ASCO|nr:hypothetical protein TRICI_004609 [Trichomonascus ciferrii]